MITRALFEEYRARPSPDALVSLLRACADPVYNVCFQVLRHRQDAEDAAQIVLLKLIAALPSAADIDRFDRWMYRVAINTALNHRKEKARRIARENRRALMNDTEFVPNQARDAVFEAIAGLDDDARCLIVQHFLEGMTLEEIARERSCSPVAVWKRIDQAKGVLKTSILGAGATVLLSGLDEVFGSVRPVRAPSSLVSEAILEKAATAAGMPVAAVVGGTIMGAKGISVATLAAISIFIFAVGTGGGYLLRSSKGKEETAGRASLATAGLSGPLARVPEGASPPADPAATPPVQLAGRTEVLGTEALLSGLKGVGTHLRAARNVALKDQSRAAGLYKSLNEEWRAIQAAALGDAALLFAFLRDSENKEILEDLIALVVGNELGPYFYSANGTRELPRPVLDGLGQMLSDGLKSQKLAVLRWLSTVGGQGKEFLGERCLNVLLTERDSEVLSTTVNTLQVYDPKLNEKLEERLDILENVWQNSRNWQVREQCLESLGRMNSPAGESLFIQKMQEILQGNDKMVAQYIPQIVGPRLQSLKLGEEDRYVPLLKAGVQFACEPYMYGRFLNLALDLPPDKAASVLETARGHCPTPEIQAGVDRAIDLLRSGETRAPVVLQALQSKS
jgi:RNA polymerase sigma-70 factor (ECF subfamily)